RPYTKCVFMATTINLGDKVITVRHKDQKNLSNCLCAVVSMRDYYHKLGGYLVFHKLKPIMEFSPGYVIFFYLLPASHTST
ncbi:hypothetical protein EDB83DRAFT_2234121, partial [Lactarius deliciosus]